ncbi:MAG TPA: hypothetical protein VNH53_01440 [Sphingomicrobium sp.]|jgi:iron complex outermembrane recepter protein|nr:hypothetical protein [Sphingomicrobium sp.]
MHHSLRPADPPRPGISAVAILLAGAIVPVHAHAASATAVQSARQNPDIVIIAPRIFSDIRPERDLDEEAIAGYAVSTVDELLAELGAELGDDDELPLIIVNGERINDLSEIGALPAEALRRVQVLPRGSAVRAGGRTGQRVVNLALTRQVRSVTTTAAHRLSTDGGWNGNRGEAIATHIRGTTRANLALRVRDESDLLESERDIVQPAPRLPFAGSGNVIAYPSFGGEIDPQLSAAAGRLVTVAAIPSTANPTLADFAARANQPAVTDVGQFRTLRPDTRHYDLNGTLSTRLAPWLSSAATVRLTRSLSRAARGLPGAVFLLPQDNPFSPFSTDVALAYYGTDPLLSRSRRNTAEANLSLNGRLGNWAAYFNARHSNSDDLMLTDRDDSLAPTPLDSNRNPFTSNLSDMVLVRTDRADARAIINGFQGSITGPVTMLPAGPLQLVVEGRMDWSRLRARSTLFPESQTVRRSEQAVRGAVDVPIASAANGYLAGLGELSATAELSRVHSSDIGALDEHAFGLTWEPREALRLRGSIERTEKPAPIQSLGSPLVVTPDVRMFDPLTGQTVDVVQLTGGNPSLRGEKADVHRLSGLLRLVPRLNLQLTAEYTDTDVRNFVSSLPEASARVMLAFPSRFIRDSNGVLTTVDLRPVNFDSHRQKRLRYGLSLTAPLAGNGRITGGSAGGDSEDAAEEREEARPSRAGRGGRPTRLRLAATHGIVFSDRIMIRPGLDPIDLLEGGAIGIASGRVRHELAGTANLTSQGWGARLGATWRGSSTLERRIGGVVDTIRFSPVMILNLRAFANAERLVPEWQWAKGTRISLNVLNLTGDRQSVRDSAGNTPLQYQPGYRDPLGRTVEIEFRRVFR